jgi:small subunit ribosomal protein S1
MDNEERKPVDAEQVEDFSQMMEEYSTRSVDFNTPVEGVIVEITGDRVIVDIGHKTEGNLPREELLDWHGNCPYQAGDKIKVLCKSINRKEGYIEVSKREVDKRDGWHRIAEMYDKQELLKGCIVRVSPDNKGFIVDAGIELFLPMSQADVRKVRNPSGLIGKEYEFRIIRLNPKEKSGVLSRRVLLEEERQEKMDQIFETLKAGQLIKGVVSSLTDYGAFVNVGGVDGLVHKDNISYGRVNHPKEKLAKGDEVEVLVLEVDRESQRISLGIKQKFPDPWADIESRYPVGKRLQAKVVKIVDFGAFIELEDGIEGLLHISDLTWEGRPKNVEEYVAVGEELWVQVIEVRLDERKIKLGLKQLEMRPEDRYIQERIVGEIVKGTVRKVLNSRVFVELEPGVEGVIKISDITYFRIDSPKEFFKEGEAVEVMIMGKTLDMNNKVRLSYKQVFDREWDDFFVRNKPGNIIPVVVKKVEDRGIRVEISRHIEGFVRLSDLDEKRIEQAEAETMFKPGDQRDALILSTAPDKKRIYLSFRAVSEQREREEIAKYMKPGSETSAMTTIGDLFENAIDKNRQ